MTMTFRDNVSLSNAQLAEGTNANTFKTTAACDFVINGRVYTKGATDNLTFTAGTAMAAKQKCAFFVLVDAAGTVTTQQSSIVAGSQSQNYVAGAWDWPSPSDKAVLGAIVIETNNSATFTPGSTDLGATDVVDTAINVALDYGTPVAY